MAPPISPYTGPGWSPPFCHVALELRSVFPIFPVRLSARLHGALFVSFPDSCVSIPHFYLGCSSLDSCLDEWLGGLCPPPLSSRILSFEWSYSPDSLILLHPAIDFVAVSLSPSLTYALPHGHCVPLGGLHVLVGSSTYPSLGCLLGPSSIGLWLCWRLGCRPVPSSHFLDSVSYLACSLDCCSYGFLRWTSCGVCPVLLAFGCFRSLAIAVCLVVFSSWLALSLLPHRDVCLTLPTLDVCCA